MSIASSRAGCVDSTAGAGFSAPGHRREISTAQSAPETGLAAIPAGWLLPELPTALLVAVFVGTGWLGYAGADRPVPDPPMTAVVAPSGPDPLSISFGER